jgi:hypothetical protein
MLIGINLHGILPIPIGKKLSTVAGGSSEKRAKKGE